MDAQGLQYVVGLSEPHFSSHAGYDFSDKKLSVITLPQPSTIVTHTLEGLVEMVKAYGRPSPLTVQVISPVEVWTFGRIRTDESREYPYKAEAILPSISFGQFMDAETALIVLRSRFVQNEATENLLKLLGSIKEEAVKTTADDGISQTVTAKVGIGTVGSVKVNPIQKLAPYRTFVEVAQPESEFLLRLQSGQNGKPPTVALFEADGGAWRIAAAKNVAAYLSEAFGDNTDIKVIL